MDSPQTSRDLLDRARDPADRASWRKLVDLYTPLIRRWARPYVTQAADADDIAQEVLMTLAAELPRFRHNQRPGAFRAWLRTITVHRIRASWQARRAEVPAAGGDDALGRLQQLEDPGSELSRSWDEEHDRHVVSTLLESIRLEFQPGTWYAFEQTVREGRPVAEVAAVTGLTPNAVLIAKSRVLKRLRQKAGALLG